MIFFFRYSLGLEISCLGIPQRPSDSSEALARKNDCKKNSQFELLVTSPKALKQNRNLRPWSRGTRGLLNGSEDAGVCCCSGSSGSSGSV